jgi:thioredoxin-like negative regulator of GroEL
MIPSPAKKMWHLACRIVTILPRVEYKRDEFGCVEVTESNFHDVVIGNKKDVLVVFYTSREALKVSNLKNPTNWKSKLKSLLDALVEAYATDASVTIATCNIAENDIPVEIYHVPSAKLYPEGKKSSPVDYFGNDDVDQYKSFMRDETRKGQRLKAEERQRKLFGKESGKEWS